MQKVIFSLLALCFCSCGGASPQEVSKLTQQKDNLETSIDRLKSQIDYLAIERAATQASIVDLKNDEAVIQAMREGKKVRYVLKVSLRQIHYTLNIKRQLSDAANESEFEIFTDKPSYDSAVIGSELFNAFRTGSMLLHGSLGSWRIEVIGKRMVIE